MEGYQIFEKDYFQHYFSYTEPLAVIRTKKTDKSKHNISIASIKWRTIKSYEFKWTKFYESNSEFPYSGLHLGLAENELIIPRP